MTDPYKDIEARRRAAAKDRGYSNYPGEPGQPPPPFEVDTPGSPGEGQADRGDGLIERLRQVIESLVSRIGGGGSGSGTGGRDLTSASDDDLTAQRFNAGGLKGKAKLEAWREYRQEEKAKRSERKRRDRLNMGGASMGDNRGDVETESSNAASSAKAARTRKQKRAAARSAKEDGGDQDQTKKDATGAGEDRQQQHAGGNTGGGDDLMRKVEDLDTKMDQLGGMVLNMMAKVDEIYAEMDKARG